MHNLPPGGARRRLANHVEHLDGEVIEICLETAAPVTSAARVIPFRPYAPRVNKALRPPLRYLDLAGLERAWRIAGREIGKVSADVVYLDPCRYLNGPPVLRYGVPRAVYFCDEPRRIDSELQSPIDKKRADPWSVRSPVRTRATARSHDSGSRLADCDQLALHRVGDRARVRTACHGGEDGRGRSAAR